MILSRRDTARGPELDVVLGNGLVGFGVTEALRPVALEPLATDWSSGDALDASLARATERLRGAQLIRVFHCAGRAGFAASEAQCAAELEHFTRVLRWAERLARDAALEFHFASSAGGLHEGQLRVGEATAAAPRRPYGRLKLAQEQALHAAALPRRFVYRISSVYGWPGAGRRSGLVATMVLNALRRRSTLITAYASTLRDYVETRDVGRFMVSGAAPLTRGLHDGVTYLVHGLPLSVGALQVLIERCLFQPVRVHYATGKDNFESMTFSPTLRPARWASSSVEANVPAIVHAVQRLPHRAR